MNVTYISLLYFSLYSFAVFSTPPQRFPLNFSLPILFYPDWIAFFTLPLLVVQTPFWAV